MTGVALDCPWYSTPRLQFARKRSKLGESLVVSSRSSELHIMRSVRMDAVHVVANQVIEYSPTSGTM